MAGAPGDRGLGGAPMPPVFGAPPGYDASVSVDELFGEDLFTMDSPSGRGGESPSAHSSAEPARASESVASSSMAGGEPPSLAAGPLTDEEIVAGRRRSKRRRQTASGGADSADGTCDDEDDEPDKRSRGASTVPSALDSVQEAADAAVEAAGVPSRAGKPRKRASTQEERLQRSRERNRIHARKSRLRKKFFVDSLKASLDALEQENTALRSFVKDTMGRTYEELVADPSSARAAAAAAAPAAAPAASSSSAAPRASRIVAGEGDVPTTTLEANDHRLMAALQTAQHNFVVSDPNMPDNPIVFASQGFYDLTGYGPTEVVGKNCRFLQGPRTDPAAVNAIREGIRRGEEVSVCLINYKKDGSPFWNQFFVAPLCDVHGRVVNFVGVQCEVPEAQARAARALRNGKPVPTGAEAVAASAASASSSSSAGAAASMPEAMSAPPAVSMPEAMSAPPAVSMPEAMSAPPAVSAPPASTGRLLPPLLPGDDAAPL